MGEANVISTKILSGTGRSFSYPPEVPDEAVSQRSDIQIKKRELKCSETDFKMTI